MSICKLYETVVSFVVNFMGNHVMALGVTNQQGIENNSGTFSFK